MLKNSKPKLFLKKLALLLSSLLASQTYANSDLARIAEPHHQLVTHTFSQAPLGLTPAQIKLAYGFANLPFAGEGQTIAIIAAYDNPNAEANLGVFNTTFNLPECTTANGCFKKIYATTQPTGSTAWGLQINLAVQWAHAIAPRAKILLVEAADATLESLFKAIDVAKQNGATVASIGWGTEEFSNENTMDATFNVPDTTFVVSTGNTGTGTTYPAVSPYVIAVGGTKLTSDAAGNYLGEVAWSGSGGGLSLYEPQPPFQANFPIPNNPNAKRGIPDVSYNADQNAAYAVYDNYGLSGWVTAGGTSVGAAQWAAFIAIIKSGSHKKLTGLNVLLYNAAKQRYNLTYNDIVTGVNGSCGYYCTARPGYDYVTGLGTPQAQYLAYEVIYNGLKK